MVRNGFWERDSGGLRGPGPRAPGPWSDRGTLKSPNESLLVPSSRGAIVYAGGPAERVRLSISAPDGTMTLYDLKPRFQGLLRPLVRRLAAAGTTANQVTVLAAFGSLALGLWLLLAPGRVAWFLVPAWLLVRMACNAVDGMLAREHGQASRLGAYLNELGDVVSDAALYLPFALLPGLPAAWVVAIVVLAGVSELAGVLGLVAGASRRYDGPLGKSDRALLFGLLGLWAGSGWPFPRWLGWALAAVAGLLAWTIVRRVRAGLREARGKDASSTAGGEAELEASHASPG